MFYFALLVSSCLSLPASFQRENGLEAQRLDSAKFSNKLGADCSGSSVVCVGTELGQCSNGIIVSLGKCGPGTLCQVLPLVNKPGTSTTCSTEQDKIQRIQNALSSTVVPGAVNATSSNATKANSTNMTKATNKVKALKKKGNATKTANPKKVKKSNNATEIVNQSKANDNVCIDDTKFKKFTSATDFVVMACPPGLCATRNPPVKNPCIGKDRAQAIDSANKE